MRKIFCFSLTIFYLLSLIYLLWPEPQINSLPDSFRSTEPGDTVEIPGVSAYYTNMTREEVINFYQKEFGQPSLRLNHSPEYVKEIIRDTIHSEFLEELVHPFRESLFINGWTPREDKDYQQNLPKPLYEFEREGQAYQSKITLYYVPSRSISRLIIFHFSLLFIWGLVYLLRSILTSKWLIK